MKGAAAARRAGWNLFDQAVSSVTNAALSFLVARSTTGAEFGGFAVAFTVFALLVGLIRAAATSPMGIRFSGVGDREFRTASASATGVSLVAGVTAGLACVVTGWSMGGTVGPALTALGLVLPGLLVQESWRQVFFAAGRPAAAAANDVVWAVVQITAVAILLLSDSADVAVLIAAWGGSAFLAALLGVRQARVWPDPRHVVSWLRRHRDLTGYMTAEFVTLQGAQQVTLLLIATLGSLEDIGSLRGVQVLLGPATVLCLAALSFAIPEFSRRRADLTRRRWIQGAAGVSGSVALLGFLWGAIFLIAPDRIWQSLLGDTWAGTSQILLITIIGQVGSAIAVGPAAMLYAMDRASVTMAVHMVYSPLVVVGGIAGVLVAGATGAAWGFAIAFWAVVPIWWIRLRREAVRITTAPTDHGPVGHHRKEAQRR